MGKCRHFKNDKINTFLKSVVLGTHAKDYCKEHEQENGGVGYCLNGGHCTNKNYGKECECMRGFKGNKFEEIRIIILIFRRYLHRRN